MGPYARSLLVLALVLAPAVSAAQSRSAPKPPPPGGPPPSPSASAQPAAPGEKAPDGKDEKDKADKKPTVPMAGYAYHDKPAKKRRRRARVSRHVKGPVATLPGFEELEGGGSRLFVQLTETVQVEERKAQGSITYVLHGTHVRRHNNTNALVTVHFNTPVTRARLVPHGKDLYFVVDLRSAVTPTWSLKEAPDKTARLVIDFPKGDYLPASR